MLKIFGLTDHGLWVEVNFYTLKYWNLDKIYIAYPKSTRHFVHFLSQWLGVLNLWLDWSSD